MPFTYRMIGNQNSVTYTFGHYRTLASSAGDAKPGNFSLTSGTASTLHSEFNDADANHSASSLNTDNQFCIFEMKVISIPTLTFTSLSNPGHTSSTATISCGIGPYDTGNMIAWNGTYWKKLGSTGYNSGRFDLAQVDQDSNQTNLVSVGDTRQVVCDPREYPSLGIQSGGAASARGHQGFKSFCSFQPMTEVTGDFVIQITRLS